MFFNDDATSVTQRPVATPVSNPGYFTDGNPATGVPATILQADFLNTIADEIANVVVASGVTLSKTNNTQLLAAIQHVSGGGRIIGLQVFSGHGTYTYTPTTGTTELMVEMVGGGGAGGGAATTSSTQVSAGSGGGGGGGARRRGTVASFGTTVIVGSGGIGAQAGNGGNGTSSSFGSTISATGGIGGSLGNAQPNTTVNAVGVAPGGIGVGGDIQMVGGLGRYAIYSSVPTSGEGGFSFFSAGAPYVNGTSSGNAGQGPGAGGSGGSLGSGAATGASGGSGHDGCVYVLEIS